MPKENFMEEQMEAYRQHLILAEQKAQEDYDKTVLALSGGALGISFAFLKDIATKPYNCTSTLFIAWLMWGGSVGVVLVSYFFSQMALRKAIHQIDEGKIGKERPGGMFDVLTATCNSIGGILFLLGLIWMVMFVSKNI